ncbi:MAG TPA: 16S rRNA (cytosine(1402)-N(4))-methyltransferase RsmH [Acidimicrobiales bacterium]|nr:16S rRNA (cytosine(1402)-N(4))-methyltransferase RsmH [Acidimicrobiales bacterium]
MSLEPNRAFQHRPVMLDEVVQLFADVPAGWLVDTTVGGAGHARALLQSNAALSVLGVDRDPEAVAVAKEVLAPFGERAIVVHARSDQAADLLFPHGIQAISGTLFDLGVSSYQLDEPGRGFSYRHDAPLDMRMDPTTGITAAEYLASTPPAQLVRLFVEHGEDRFAKRIVSAIAASQPVQTTGQLAEVVAGAVPAAARRRGHPAKRVFQALRVAVNSELAILPAALEALLGRLVPGGRAVVISYHSGEDRMVKEVFNRAATGGCTCPPGLPCVCGAVPTVRLLNRGARKATPGEVEANPRAKGARLRAVEALGMPIGNPAQRTRGPQDWS